MGKIIVVVDGQGGRLGSLIVQKCKPSLPAGVEIVALGTNALATAQMMKAGADRGASGENAIIHTVASAHVILGSLSIVMPNSMLGELTAKMAGAIVSSPAVKLLLPVNNEGIRVMGVRRGPLSRLLEDLCQEPVLM